MIRSLTLSAALLCALSTAYAQQPQKKAATGTPVIQSATSQVHTSRDHHEPDATKYIINAVWKGPAPTEMYYKPDAVHWLKCKVVRPERRPMNMGNPNDFMVIDKHVPVTDLHDGDQVHINPETFQSETQPDAVKKMAARSIYYRTSATGAWRTVKVKITELPDLVE